MHKLKLKNIFLLLSIFLFSFAANGETIINNDFVQVDNLRLDGNTLSSQNANGDININPNGSGDVIFNDLTATTVPYLGAAKQLVSSAVTPTELGLLSGLTGTVLTSANSVTATNKTFTSPVINTSVSGTAILDEDNFASNSNTQLATQQSIKAYVDGNIVPNLGFYSGNISGGNPSLGTSSLDTYTELTHSSLSLSVGTDSTSMGIACTAPATETQEVGDTTCTGSEGDEVIGVVITPASTTRYLRMCFSFGNAAQDGGSGTNLGLNATFQLTVTENNATTILYNGQDKQHFVLTTTSVGGAEVITTGAAFYVCGLFKFANTNIKRITLRYEQLVTGTLTSHIIYGDAASTAGQRDISIFGYYLP